MIRLELLIKKEAEGNGKTRNITSGPNASLGGDE